MQCYKAAQVLDPCLMTPGYKADSGSVPSNQATRHTANPSEPLLSLLLMLLEAMAGQPSLEKPMKKKPMKRMNSEANVGD